MLALAVTVGLLAALLSMGRPGHAPSERGGRLTAITLSPSGTQDKPKAQAARQAHAARAQPAPQRAATPPRAVVPAVPHYSMPPGFIPLTRQDFAAADIGRMGSAGVAGSAGAGQTGEADSAAGADGGPDGVRLYRAEWYRRPRDAELQGYLQPGQATGAWAMIACRTVAQYRVEDCRELDESPRGSGMARVLRRAAWQFLVRPPSVNGRPLVGAWVSIRFDFRPGEGGEG